MTSSALNPETTRIAAAVPELVEAGNVPRLADVLIDAIAAMEYIGIVEEAAIHLEALRAMTSDQRAELVGLLLPRFGDLRRSQYDGLVQVVEMLTEGLDEKFVVAAAEAELAHAAGFFEYIPLNRPIEWAATISAGGGTFTPEMIAVVRRHQHIPYVKRTYRKLFIDFADPVLSVGEAWADQVLADLPELGEAWLRLVRHAATATGTKPSATWDRKATAMLAEIGHEPAAQRLTAWLGLVSRPRTVALQLPRYHESTSYDAFNVIAVRGLVWAASLLPADTKLTRVIGTLVTHALSKVNASEVRSVKLAGAAVLGLERIPGEDAAAELKRLEDRISHGTVLRQVRGARATRP